MTIHIDYDREENKIQFILDSQGSVIRTLVIQPFEEYQTKHLFMDTRSNM